MKRREFIALWSAIRSFKVRQMVNAGQMRQSEAAMALLDVSKQAVKLWNKHRADYRIASPDWLLNAVQIRERSDRELVLFEAKFRMEWRPK